jgi:selenocysteine lyase/cysteine desulfurase
VADEAYWRDVKAQFMVRDGFIMMNAANLCPAPRAVVDAVAAAMRDVDTDVSFQNRDKYSGSGPTCGHEWRSTWRRRGEVAIVRNTSEANNIVVGGVPLKAGDDVLLFDENHPTNNVAWDVRAARYGFTVRKVKIDPASRTPAPSSTRSGRRCCLTRESCRSRTCRATPVVRLPSAELCALARERGIWAHVDGAQTLGALRRDLHALGCDSYSASSHKWFMGPKEAGVLFVRKERCAELWPGVVGVGWGKRRHDPGAGRSEVRDVRPAKRRDRRRARCGARLPRPRGCRADRDAHARADDGAPCRAARDAWRQVVTPARPEMRAGVCVVRFEGREMRPIHEALYRDHHIATAPTGGLRFSPHIYNAMADVERALAAVRGVAGSG